MIDIDKFINETKSFWKITNFKEEILDWKFNLNENIRKEYIIGHPLKSHKGTSVGDILPYTRLPEELKKKYPYSKVKVPSWFWPFFETNPNVDGINDSVYRWGSLGTWGTTVQRTTNVWGIRTFKFDPIIYLKENEKQKKTILFCINSKTGGKIKNIKIFEDFVQYIRKEGYYCVQLALKDEDHVKGMNKYVFNLQKNKLIHFAKHFEYYIGAQNSIYHLCKALGSKLIGILPENIDPEFIMLPLLTQINIREIEMLTKKEKERAKIWENYIRSLGKDPNESHHCGWLYPDTPHLTSRENGTFRCPSSTVENIVKALNNEIYPFNDARLWDFENHTSLWG